MPLIKYTGSQFLFNHSAYKSFCEIDSEFAPKLDIINSVAKKYGIQIYTTSSYRADSNHIQGAVVKPATTSNHFVGHAIDCNLLYKGKIYNSTTMSTPSGDILLFIKECKEKGIRWGGDFAPAGQKGHDPVHFDDGLNKFNRASWDKKYKEYHA